MDKRIDYRYYVVKFSDPPYSDIDQYVCIPDSWIQLREIADQVVVTKFPVENLSITKKRVKDGEVFSDSWSIYVAEVKYGTDSYEDAEKYINNTLGKKIINTQSYSEPGNNDDGLSKISKSLRRSKRNQSNLSVNKPQISEARPVSEQLAVISTEIANHKKQTRRSETINSAYEVIYQTNALSESGEQLPSNRENYSNKITLRRKKYNEKPNNVDFIESDNSSQDMAGNETTENPVGPQLTNELLDPIISEPISDKGNPGLIKDASDIHSEDSFLLYLDQMCDAFSQNCKDLERFMNKIKNCYGIGSNDPINTTIKETVAPVVEERENGEKEIEKKRQVAKRTQAEIGIIKRKETERIEQENDNGADKGEEDDDEDDYVKRKRFQSRPLTLPPEFDKNDSKWTLRYREYAPGLVELIEHTGVYINAVKLSNCKRLAKNSKQLARLLLVEIFTESALYTCSLTGVRAKSFDIDGTRVRPGLDENARTVLLAYVEQYTQDSKWPKLENQSILNSMRNKMQEIRFKYKK